jgi:hypothetical protein
MASRFPSPKSSAFSHSSRTPHPHSRINPVRQTQQPPYLLISVTNAPLPFFNGCNPLKVRSELWPNMTNRRKLLPYLLKPLSHWPMIQMRPDLVGQCVESPRKVSQCEVDIPSVLLFKPVVQCHPLHRHESNRGGDAHHGLIDSAAR